MKKLNAALSVIFFALFLAVSVTVSAQAPVNDLICNATPLSIQLGCTQATNVNATSTGSPAAPACWAPNSTSNDVWFSFVATVPDITISTDAQGLTLTNTQVAVYSSSNNTCTGTLTLVGCAENSGFNVVNNSVTDLALTVGQTYFIRVDGNGTATGTFCISVANTYTPGSTPCEAQIVHPNSNTTCDIDNGNAITNATLPATAYFPIGVDYGGCDNETAQYGTWVTFTANAASVTLTNQSGGARDYTFFTGTCSNLQWISCTSVASAGTTTFSNLTVGSQYFLLTTLQNGATTTGQSGSMCIRNNVACTPPANNTCANAQAVTENVLYHVTTYCATPDNPPLLCSGSLQNNIWFTWTAPSNWTGQAYFQLFNQNCAGGNLSDGTQVSIYQPGVVCGSTANCIATSNTAEDNNLNVVWTPTAGTTYLINYDGNAGEVCEMDFQITNSASVVVVSVNSPTICAGDSVVLTASSQATGYVWSTGQTGSSITVSPSVTTTYSVSATAGGTGSATSVVTVNPIPASPVAGSNSPVCAGSSLNLTASTIANADYSWTGPNGFSSTQQNPTIANVTTAASGTYIVSATVLGCANDPDTISVTVNPLPAAPVASSNSPLCAGNTLNLTATGANGATFSWTGPNSFTSAQQNPSITNITTAVAGTYSVTQTVLGCTGSVATTQVTVNPSLPAPQVSSNSPICAGSTLTLSAASSTGASYNWSGPNGFTSTQQNPSIANATTAATGTYTVYATALGCSSDTASLQVIVNPLPVAPTAASNSPICAGSTLNLTATGSNSATYSWTGPNGFTSTQQNPSIASATTAASGTYSVTQTELGCTSAPGTTQVTVNPIPTTTASNNSPICSGASLNVNATSFSGATYSWIGPNGFTSTQQSFTIANAAVSDAGVYTVTVTANGCTGTPSSTTVTINAVPPPTAGSNSPICSGATLNLTASNVNGASYSWTGPNGFTSNLQNPSITNATTADAGTYYVTANVSGCNSSNADSVVVVVNPIPGVTASSNTPVCQGGTINLTASTFAGAAYSWTGPNGFTSNQQNPSISNATVAMSGTYSVTTSANNCSSTTPATTSVTVVPTTPPTAGNNTPTCSGGTINLTAGNIAGADYAWTGPNGFASTLQNPTITNATTAQSGTYSVIATINGCASSSPATTTVVVNPIPNITASNNGPLCEGSILNLTVSTFAGASYTWTGPNGFTSNQQNSSIPNVTLAAAGTYSVVATASGCSSSQPATTIVVVNAIPSTPVATSNSPICDGDNLDLFANSIAGANYIWTGPNGFISLVQNPSIIGATTSNSGLYQVDVVVNGCTSSTGSILAIVNGIPAGTTATSNSPVCEGDTIRLFSGNVTGATYSWIGPGGFTSTAQNPIITNAVLANSGEYAVAITVNGCTSISTATDVVVNAIPPSPVPGSNSPVCEGGTLLLTATTIPDATYLWTDPIGFPNNDQNPIIDSVTMSANGTFTVVAIVNGCVSPPATITVVISPKPTVSFTSNAPVCSGLPVNFTNTGSTGASYFWNFGSGATPATSTLENPMGIVYSTGGVKSVTLTVTTPGCVVSTTQTIQITGTPFADFTSDAPVCFPPGIVTFTDLSIGTITSWSWDFGDGATPPTSTSAGPISVTYDAIGTKTVTLTVNSGGCTFTTTKTVDVGVVGADFTSSVPMNGDGGCLGHGENFYTIGSTGSGASHYWNFGAGATPATSTLENPTNIVYSTTGAKIVTHIVNVAACGLTDTFTHIITINPTPVASFTSTAPVCQDGAVDFTYTDTVGNGYSFAWNFGDGASPATETAENPTGVTYTTPGHKNVTLTVTNQFYCVDEVTQSILINASPTASFTSTAPACSDLPVTFTNTGTATANTTWAWDFSVNANPSTSTLQQPGNVVYYTAGSKTVTLTATDTSNGCSAVASQTFNIYQSPTAAFLSNAPQCSDAGINFTNIGSTGSNWSYSWNFGTGANPAISTAENPSGVTYSSGGNKTVTFTIADQNCTRTQTQTIVVDETPTATISSSAPKCAGAPVDFSNSGTTTDVTWLWDFGTGATPANSTAQNPTGVVYSTGGLKTVTLTATNSNSGCSVTKTITIEIYEAPTASFTSNAPQCPNLPVDFTNTGSTGNQWTYIWSFGVGANPSTSASENPSVEYNTSGTKTVTFTLTNGFCTSSVTDSVLIYTAPVASFITDAPQCTGVPVNFTNGSYVPSADVTWLWDFGSGAQPISSADEIPTSVIYTTAGAKTVTLTVTDTISRCVSVATQNFTIYQSPTATFTSTAPQCANNAIDFTNTGTTGSGWTYSWSFGSGANPATSSSESPSGITYSTSGTKTVTFTIASQHCIETATQTISVNSTPTASFVSTTPKCTGLAVDFTNTGSTTNVTWSWNLGAGATPATSTDENPTGVTYSTPGIKTVTLTTTDTTSGCSVSATATFNIFEGPTATFTSTAPQCANTAIDFTNTGTTGGNWSYSWNFGSGATPSTSTAENPTGVTYSTGGTKTVTFTISDQNCTQTSTQSIVINATPAASFVSTGPKCTGLGVDFTNTGTLSGVTWAWSFDTGATPDTSTDQNPVGVTYSTSGIKTVTLTTTDTTSGCAVTATGTVNIFQSPTATFTSNAPQCANVAIDFTNTGSTGNNWSYAWNFGDGANPAVSTAESPSGVLYSSAGIKTVTFTISDQNCTQTSTQFITINATPSASFVSTAPQCTGLPVIFENTSGTTANVSWNWSFGGSATPSTSTDQIPSSVVYSTAGLQTVTLTATDTTSGCSVSTTSSINIYQTPTATFTSTAPQCANTAISFTNTGSTGSNWSYFWNLGAGALPATSSAENPTGVTYGYSGTKTVTFTISDQHCTQTSTQSIVISSTPVASFLSTAPQCTGLGVDFKNTGTVTGVTWNWNFGLDATPATSTTQDQSGVVYSTAGVKTVTLTTTDTSSGCSVTATNSFTIHQTPVATFTSTAPQCANTGVDFVNTGNTGSNWSYSWNFGLGASPSVATAESVTGVTYSSSGVKTVTLTISDQNCTQTSTQTITILETPRASFTSTAPQCTGLPVNFTNLGTTTGVTWSWDFGTGASPAASTVQDPSNVVYGTAGIKTVTLITTNGTTSCSATSTQTIIIHQSPTATFTSNAPQCANVGINFTNTGSTGSNWSYSWDLGQDANPATSSSQNPSGVLYSSGGTKLITFSISDANCTTTDTQSIVINALPAAFAGPDTTICANRSVQLGTASTAGNTYSWFPSSTLDNPFVSNPIASPVAPVTNYIVTVVNTATGCSNSDVVVVTMLPPLTANAGVDVEICANDSVQIGTGLVEGQFYQWSPPDGLSSTSAPNPVATPTSTTTYTLVVTDTTGCDAVTDNVTVIVNPLPVANAGVDDTITKGVTIQLVGTGGIQFHWGPEAGLSNANLFNPTATPDSTTNYVLTVTDLFGCTNTDTVLITVFDYATPYWLPSAFTPDANGHNDVLFVRGGGFKNFQFSVYNRYGELIFLTKDIKTGWDGKNQFTSDDAPADAYVYKLNGLLETGEKVDVKGLVNLIR